MVVHICFLMKWWSGWMPEAVRMKLVMDFLTSKLVLWRYYQHFRCLSDILAEQGFSLLRKRYFKFVTQQWGESYHILVVERWEILCNNREWRFKWTHVTSWLDPASSSFPISFSFFFIVRVPIFTVRPVGSSFWRKFLMTVIPFSSTFSLVWTIVVKLV